MSNIWLKIKYYFIKNPKKRATFLKQQFNYHIGENCEIYKNVSFGSEPFLIEIGDNVRLTEGVRLTTHDGGVWVIRNLFSEGNAGRFGKIRIGSNVHIGINTIIMPNVNIGDNVVIGAGAIVTKDIPNNVIAVGVPAKPIKSIEEYYTKNKDSYIYLDSSFSESQKKEYLTNRVE